VRAVGDYVLVREDAGRTAGGLLLSTALNRGVITSVGDNVPDFLSVGDVVVHTGNAIGTCGDDLVMSWSDILAVEKDE
tara:strand:+ start:1159 stop:1392 length:234 start_codon:yes stop_codon:yes gene_type:complete